MKIRNLKELNLRIQALEEEERREKNALSASAGQASQLTENFELALYIGRVAAEIFQTWRKPQQSKRSRWKNIIVSLLIMVGIHFAQRYLEDLFKDKEED